MLPCFLGSTRLLGWGRQLVLLHPAGKETSQTPAVEQLGPETPRLASKMVPEPSVVPALDFTALPAAKGQGAGLDAGPGTGEVGISSRRDDALKSFALHCDFGFFPLPLKEKQRCP